MNKNNEYDEKRAALGKAIKQEQFKRKNEANAINKQIAIELKKIKDNVEKK